MDLLHQITSTTYTLSDLHRRVQLLKNHLNETVFSKKKTVDPDIDDVDQVWLQSLTLSDITKENVATTIEKLEEETKNVIPLVIFLPIVLPQNEAENVGKKLRADFGEGFFIEFRFDPQLIAGAAMAYKGIYKDYSLRQSLKDNHEGLVANFKRYLR